MLPAEAAAREAPNVRVCVSIIFSPSNPTQKILYLHTFFARARALALECLKLLLCHSWSSTETKRRLTGQHLSFTLFAELHSRAS